MINYLLNLNPRTPSELSQAKRELAAKFKRPIPTNSELIEAYKSHLLKTKINPNPILLSLLKRRQVRTLSGVAPVAILTKPYPCPGKCFYCPNEKGMPKSYLSNEPAVMRAILTKFDPKRQIVARLTALLANGHNVDKIELIIMGGTWSYLPKSYQLDYIINCFKACNEFDGQRNYASLPRTNTEKWKFLRHLQKENATSSHRIVGLTLETRPDYITAKEIERMRALGCTRVELGVQAIDEEILSLNKRGHGVKEIIKATKFLREAGFKICYHMMVGLPGSDLRKDFEIFRELFSNSSFLPDQIKIYPCVVTKNASLYKWYKNGRYKPYQEEELIELLIKIKKIVPPYVRIIRVIRDIPTTSIIAGNKVSNLREILLEIMENKGTSCQCIRCREIGNKKIISFKFITRSYDTASGKEYFLSYEDTKQNKIIAFLRLRLPYNKNTDEIYKNFPALKNAALIREVHTYGPAVKISKREKDAAQHIGLGKKLIKKAEQISRRNGFQKIAVISGIGVRNYYRKQGYKLKETYMVKKLK